jgi:peptidoglycan/xylan/chitin deacetylase (PgdA/CDA1 family)
MSHKPQAVVLTYHRILDAKTASARFHDLSFDCFRKQMEVIAARALSHPTAPKVYITFDNCPRGHFEAGNLLSELGLTGTFFITTGRFGQEGYLTRDQVLKLARNGHRIGSHTVSRPHLTKVSMAELDHELITSKKVLEDLTGQTIDWLAPQGGIYNSTVLERAFELGYSVVRTMEWGYADLPLQGRITCFPVLAISHPDSFVRILDGKASVWPYVAKTYLKKFIGEAIYSKLRDRIAGISTNKSKTKLKIKA